jgi:hypothetical protein
MRCDRLLSEFALYLHLSEHLGGGADMRLLQLFGSVCLRIWTLQD